MAIKLLSDLVTVVSEHISNPSTSGFEIFVGLEHYDAGEPVITRFGSTANLESSVKHFIEGDILVARRNVYLKRAGVVKFEGVTSGDSIVLRVKDECYKDIIPFILNTEEFWDYAEQNSDGTMSKRLAPDVLLEYECDIPDNHKDIAKKLWAAYELKEAYKKMIAATDEMVKSQFIEMFGDQNINDRQWDESLVKDEFKLSMGKTPARNNPYYWEGGSHKWISISDMSLYTRFTGETTEYITDVAIAESGIRVVPKGTIIMSFKLSIGRTAITSEDVYTNEAIMAFSGFDTNKFNIDFLHFLIANKNWSSDAKQAVKGQTLNKESIGNAKIIVPPMELQEEFARIYNQADKSKFELRQAIDKIDKVMKSLLQ